MACFCACMHLVVGRRNGGETEEVQVLGSQWGSCLHGTHAADFLLPSTANDTSLPAYNLCVTAPCHPLPFHCPLPQSLPLHCPPSLHSPLPPTAFPLPANEKTWPPACTLDNHNRTSKSSGGFFLMACAPPAQARSTHYLHRGRQLGVGRRGHQACGLPLHDLQPQEQGHTRAHAEVAHSWQQQRTGLGLLVCVLYVCVRVCVLLCACMLVCVCALLRACLCVQVCQCMCVHVYTRAYLAGLCARICVCAHRQCSAQQ